MCAQIASHFYHTQHFGLEEGLAHENLIDMTFDRHGMMWVYSAGGLQHFDGLNFTSYNHLFTGYQLYGFFNPLPGPNTYLIRNDGLYLLDSNTYVSHHCGVLPLVDKTEEWRQNTILFEDPQYLYIWHTSDTMYQVDKEAFAITDTFTLPVRPINRRTSLARRTAIHSETEFEYVGEDYNLYLFNSRTAETKKLQDLKFFGSACRIGDDTIVTLTSTHLNIIVKGNRHEFPVPVALQVPNKEGLLLKSANILLVAFAGDIYEFDLRLHRWIAQYFRAGGGELVDIGVRQMLLDKTGHLFCSSFTDGMFHLHPRNPGFHYIGTNQASKNFARRLEISNLHNVVFMGTLTEGLFLFDTLGNFLKQYKEMPDGTVEHYISHILKIDESRFLILAKQAYLLSLQKPDWSLQPLDGFNPSWLNYYDVQIASKNPGKLYLNTYLGLLTCTVDKRITFEYQTGHPLRGSMAIIPFGDGYLSCVSKQLSRYDNTLSRLLEVYTLPGFGAARCMVRYSSNQVLVGADAGLYLIEVGDHDARIVEVLYDKMVYAILPGADPGEFWFSTDFGIFFLNAELQIFRHSRESGLQENEFNTNACVKSTSGRLYFGGVHGITAFHPSGVLRSNDSIRSIISSIMLNGKVISRYPSSALSLRLSSGQNHLGVALLGKGLKPPSGYNYQYFMKGLDRNWVDLGNDTRINFHLAPGTYTFYYHIGDQFNPGITVSPALHILIRPPFLRRWWVITIGASALLFTAWYFFELHRRRRLLKLQYEQQLGANLQKERIRISRELHDNIGAQMATVKRNINFLVNNSNRLSEEDQHRKMKDLENISTQINQELRDTIWATQSEYISMKDFVARLKNYIFQVLGSESPMRVQYAEHCDLQMTLSPFVALNLHRICQETINNAVKHSGATDMRIVFERQNELLVVAIMDNGKGFDVNAVSNGFGLKNIQHRAAQIGATLFFNRLTEKGSSLEIFLSKLQASDNS